MLKRYGHNPILVANSGLPWCSKKVYNCAVYKEGQRYLMLFRGIGDDWISRLGLAESTDGVNFTVDPTPVLSPLHPWEVKGCEDPRMVKFDDTYWVTYTAFDGDIARAAITSSTNLRDWGDRKLLFPDWQQQQRENLPSNWSKAAALFPQKVGDKYYLLFGDSHIWPAVSSNLTDWEPHISPLISAREGYFDAGCVEMGPPPVQTSRGWLVLYHGIDRLDSQRVYSLGAVLLDSNDPLKVIWRSHVPILAPHAPYETMGMIDVIDGGFSTLKTLQHGDLQRLAHEHRLPKAVFCCAATLDDGDTLRLYYSGADTVICTATVDLEAVFSA